MIKRIFGLWGPLPIAVLCVILWHQISAAYTDTLFVKENGRTGVYREITGSIDTLFKDHLFMKEADGNRVLYTKEVVKLIGLDRSDSSRVSKYQPIIRRYWNVAFTQEIVEPVKKIPWVGGWIYSGLSILPPGFDIFFAIIIMLLVLSYLSYRGYNTFILTAKIRDLNRDKLNYEIIKLKKDIGLISEEAHAEFKVDRRGIDIGGIIPEVKSIWEFLKYKVLRILTKEQKELRSDSWSARWSRYRDKGAAYLTVFYYLRLGINIIFMVLVFIIAFSLLITSLMIFLAPSTFSDFGGGYKLFMILFYLMLSIAFLAFLIRLWSRIKIIRSSYRDFKAD